MKRDFYADEEEEAQLNGTDGVDSGDGHPFETRGVGDTDDPGQPSNAQTQTRNSATQTPGFDRLPGESSKAFRAFCDYRNLEYERSLEAAWNKYREDSQQRREARGRPRLARRKTHCPGQWTEWSVKYQWVERAAQYDAYLDEKKRAVLLQRAIELEERRFDLELEYQQLFQDNVQKVDEILDKAKDMPITTFVRTTIVSRGSKILERIKTRVQGIDFAGYAALLREQNKMAKVAILGFRPPGTKPRLFELCGWEMG